MLIDLSVSLLSSLSLSLIFTEEIVRPGSIELSNLLLDVLLFFCL
jgi:hypothetical protein